MDDLRVLSQAYHLLDRSGADMGDRFKKKLLATIADDGFLHAMFKPTLNKDKEEIQAYIGKVWDLLSKKSTVNALVEGIEDYGIYAAMRRETAVLLTTIINLSMSTIDTSAGDLGRAHDHGEISDREYDRSMDRLNRYQNNIKVLLKYTRKIVKAKSKNLAANCGLPKDICAMALMTAPGPNFTDNYRLGFYLKSIMSNMYGYINANPEEFQYSFDDVDWKLFFGTIFGKQRLPDIASLLLLDGVESIDRFKNAYHEVRSCWSAVNNFALSTLNNSSETIRDQMMELYLKRVKKLLANHNINLTIDLRSIDDLRFDRLAETVSKYRSKIDDILGACKNIINDKPTI